MTARPVPLPCGPTPDPFASRCACGHLWLFHDVEEYHGDGSDMCCVDGCTQVGCPGRAVTAHGDPARTALRPAEAHTPEETR